MSVIKNAKKTGSIIAFPLQSLKCYLKLLKTLQGLSFNDFGGEKVDSLQQKL